MKKKVIFIILSMTITLFSLCAVNVFAATYNDLTYEIYNDTVTITSCTTDATKIEIPEEIEGCPVTAIGDSAFCYRSNLTTITIPDSVTSIGDSAFLGCYNLESIDIPNSVTSIGNNVFSYCHSLTSAKIPESITSIGHYAFEDCDSLTSIDIPDSVISIGIYAFNGCESLTSINIPSIVISIGSGAFYRCNSLTNITVDENNSFYCSIDGILFSKDKTTLIQYPARKGNSTYTIPNSVTTISSSAFSNCETLTEITILDGVKNIASNAFSSCTSLISINIPSSVTYIGQRAFQGCSSLVNITVAEDDPSYCSIDGNLFSKDKTVLIQYAPGKNDTTYIVPDNVTTIGYSAFWYCSELIDIAIGPNVTTIKPLAFAHCKGITTITIPNNVTYIGSSAFSFCPNLKDVYFNGTKHEWTAISIEDQNESLTNATIHFKPCTYTTVSNNKQNFTVKPYSIDAGSIILLATYNNGKLADLQSKVYVSEDITFTTTEEYTTAKVIVWESMQNMKPIAVHEDVKLSSGSGGGVYIPPSGGTTATYTVTFKFNNGARNETQTVTSGNKVTKPDDPTKELKIFTGWYTDSACTNLYNFDNSVTSSFTLYAGWEDDIAAINEQKIEDVRIFKEALAATEFDPSVPGHQQIADIIVGAFDRVISGGPYEDFIVDEEYIRATCEADMLQVKNIWENELYEIEGNPFYQQQTDFKDKIAVVLTDAKVNGFSMTLSQSYEWFRKIFCGIIDWD